MQLAAWLAENAVIVTPDMPVPVAGVAPWGSRISFCVLHNLAVLGATQLLKIERHPGAIVQLLLNKLLP